jgi:hypothetical protein
LKNGNIAKRLPFMEGLLPFAMKMSKKGKHGKWNKTFTSEKLRETADVIKR